MRCPVLVVLLVAIGIGVAWPRTSPLLVVAGMLASVATMRFDGDDSPYSVQLVANPYRLPALMLLIILLVVGARWRMTRPTPRRVLRRLAGYGALVVVAFTALSLREPPDIEAMLQAVVGGATVLIGCLLVELHLHVPPVPEARVVDSAALKIHH